MHFIKSLLKIFFITIFVSLVIDFFFGKFILNSLDGFFSKTQFYERLIRIDHPVYHHTLKPNIDYTNNASFTGTYRLCTNNHGFKSKCGIIDDKKYDLAFMGDSFVEGTPVEFEDTFVGLFENKSNFSVANLGIVSYSPKIYLSKLKFLLDKKFFFKHVIIFVDISDFYDDSNFYSINKKLIVSEKFAKEKNLKIRKILRKNFPLTNFYTFVLKKINLKEEKIKQINKNQSPKFLPRAQMKAIWTFSKNDQLKNYTMSIADGHKQMFEVMTQLYNLLNEKGIDMSVAIYPWPQQLQNDSVNSIHVKYWENFCKNKCKNFINFFPVFFNEMGETSFLNVYKKYYFWNDVHFNKKGHQLIADYLIKQFNF